MAKNETNWQVISGCEIKLYESHADYEDDYSVHYRSMAASLSNYYRFAIFGVENNDDEVLDSFESFIDEENLLHAVDTDFKHIDYVIVDVAVKGKTLDLYTKGDSDIFVKYDGVWVDAYDFSGIQYREDTSRHRDEKLGFGRRIKKSKVDEFIICSAFSGLSATELNHFLFDNDLTDEFNFDETDTVVLMHVKL